MTTDAQRAAGLPPHTLLGSVIRKARESFRTLLSGTPDGRPDWVLDLGHGELDGVVPAHGATWAVHGALPTLVGGIRALFLQAAHPLALTAVADHSVYRDDPLGRLRRTTKWLTVTTFGDVAAAQKEAARVRGAHRRVSGTARIDGVSHPYRADDQDLLAWVHIAFTDSFLSAHLALGGPAIPGGPDAYVAEWAGSARLLGLADPPTTRAELDALLTGFRSRSLGRAPATSEVVDFLRDPPLPGAQRAAYRVLSAAALATMHPVDLAMLKLDRPASRVAIPAARTVLAGLSLLLGPVGPAQQEAERRIADRVK